MQSKQFTVRGMTCVACKKLIEMVAGDYPQIKTCDVDYKTGHGVLEYEDGFDPGQFRNEINNEGKYTLEFNE